MFLQRSQWSLILLMQRLTEESLFEVGCWLLGSILRFCKSSLYALFSFAQFINCFGTSSVSSTSKNLQSLVGLPFFLGISLFGSSVPLQSLLYKSLVSLLCCFSIMKSKFINFSFRMNSLVAVKQLELIYWYSQKGRSYHPSVKGS